MIYKKCVMTIDKNKATLDEDIYLYRLDKNIELYFTIVNNKYRFNKGDMNNIILITNASFFQVRLYKNAEIKYTFAIQPTDGGQAILTITDDLIDDPIEVGDYDFQISLLDEEKTSMISMPIVSKQLHVCEPLVSDDATMGKAILGLSKLATGEIKNAFDSDGNYIREIHKDGDILSASIINKFEEALDTNTKAIKNGTGTPYDDTEIKTDINTIKTDLGTGTLNTTAQDLKGAINEVFQSASNGKTLIAQAITGKGVATSNTDTFQTMADNINKIEGDDKLLYKFGVVSDNHCATAYNAQNKMIKVLNYYNNSDVDFVCSCGDITTDKIEHLDWLKSKMSELKFSKPFYAVRGNHDVYLTNEQWKSYFGQEPNFTFNKGDDMFIFLSIDNNTANPFKYDNAWPYLQTLDVANKRVFLIQHFSWEGKAGEIDSDVRGFKKDNVVGNNIYNYFSSNLIAFTGHTHHTFECEEQIPRYDMNIYNENRLSKTVVHCPSTGYAMDKDRNIQQDIAEGWICEVYSKKIILKAIDFNTSEYMPNYVYTINSVQYESEEPKPPTPPEPEPPTTEDDDYNIYKFDTTKTVGDKTVTLFANRRGDTTTWDGVTDWGDGTTDTNLTHTYAEDGVYVVKTKHDLDHSASYKNNTRFKLIDCLYINKNMTDLADFFNYCINVVEFTNIRKWDISKVINLHCTFMKCRGLTKLDLSGWITDNVTVMDNTFNGCGKLAILNLSGWNTSNVTRADATFRGCSALTILNLSSWITTKMTNMNAMLYACSKLATLDISNFNMDNVTNDTDMFTNCTALHQSGITMTNCNEATKTKINSMVAA